jgi:hypothetical protein
MKDVHFTLRSAKEVEHVRLQTFGLRLTHDIRLVDNCVFKCTGLQTGGISRAGSVFL